MYKEADEITNVNIRRLEWFGHVDGMVSNEITKIAFDNTSDYKRLKGIATLKWIDDVQKDLKHARNQ